MIVRPERKPSLTRRRPLLRVLIAPLRTRIGPRRLRNERVLPGGAARIPRARLEEAAADVVYMLAVPFLGTGEAARLAAGAARRRHLRAVA
jgi:hypothetical protein